jgi:hypothetical protein
MARLGREELRDAQPNFSGGLNIATDRSKLRDNELWKAEEIRYTELAAATKRGGTQRIHAAALTAATPVRGGYSWRKSGTAAAVDLAICGGLLYKLTYAIPVVPTLLGGTFNAAAYPSFAAFPATGGVDSVFIADGGALNSTDGTTVTMRIAGTPNVGVLFTYNRRLYGCQDTANPDVLYFSALDKGDTLGNAAAGGGAALVRTAGARDIMLGAALNEALALIHRESISRWTGFTQDDIAVQSGVQGFAADVGGTAFRSLVMNEKVGVFLSDRGFYEMSDGGLRPLASKIEPMIVALDHTLFSRACGVNSRSTREMFWYLPDVGIYCYNYRLLDPDTGVGAWSGPWKGIFTSAVVHSMWQTLDGSGTRIVLAGFGDGFIRRLDAPGIRLDDVLSDGTGGTAIVMNGVCHRMFFKTPTHEKSFRRVWVTSTLRGTSTLAIALECATGVKTWTFAQVASKVWGIGKWGSGKWGGSGGAVTRKADLAGRGTYCDVTFTETGPSAPAISRIEVQGFDLGERA